VVNRLLVRQVLGFDQTDAENVPKVRRPYDISGSSANICTFALASEPSLITATGPPRFFAVTVGRRSPPVGRWNCGPVLLAATPVLTGTRPYYKRTRKDVLLEEVQPSAMPGLSR